MTDGAHRRRIIAAAIELTARSGWSTVTMAALAETVGVSRQTVYNEIGSKQALAEAMVHDELGRFLAAVERAFDRDPDDLAASIRGAVRAVLDLARDNALLRAIVSATHDADTALLPLLTTHASSLLTTAKAVLTHRLTTFAHPLDDHQFAVTIDVVVRAVLSHVMQPSDTPERTADDIAWLVDAVITRPGAVAGTAPGAAGGSR
ncbi:TetR family transcriptional regulator [Umezawaea endophytica]|uniref:TetR family transcriptional regulator n=1 Tax=Umezawaea endophytica TaxID=1654476 RepID=A0A9X2ZYT9_9PSEU|nr:TetR family transcriptional regulator [Umezawaea endophytica]MCS7475243.1 TetR family transcriptional regulator [Umezawaea endophytica]